jgi:CubicO group peptidase (beta-lactamase class C family)
VLKYASPVALKPDGPDRWSGEVVPFEDVFTLYLMVQRRPDGSLDAYLRNPERNYGLQLGIERLTIEGNRVNLLGRRPGQQEDRAMATGVYDPENEVITLNFPARGGTYDFRREGTQSAFYPRGLNAGRYTYRPPLQRDDGWPTGTLKWANIDRTGIEAFIQMILDRPMESVRTPQIHGILVARHGRLVLEEYFHGDHRDKLHDLRSAAKSLTATIAGAALQTGSPLELSSRVYDFMRDLDGSPELEPEKRAMTLEHLLTMASGFYCDDTDPDAPGNEDTLFDQTDEPDYYRYTLRLPMVTMPGERAVYCSVNANLVLGVIAHALGESPLYTFDRLIGEPLKIHRYAWLLDPAGNPYGGGSVHFLPRDFMKLGQLMLNGGSWKGRQILDPQYVTRASNRLYHLRNIYYGFLWWGIDFPYKERTVRAFFAGGNGGQGVLVIPELDLVIATYGGNYSDRATIHIQQELTPRYILPAVREVGDDGDIPAPPGNYVSPYGPSPNAGPVIRPPRD